MYLRTLSIGPSLYGETQEFHLFFLTVNWWKLTFGLGSLFNGISTFMGY